MMSQFPAFFHDSVRDNFRVAEPQASDEQIQSISELTGLWPLLQRAVGSDTLNRPFASGAALSGGQKKLFALTRCLLRNPTFLLLDEPTTNMDNEEKYSLIPLMKAACAGKTVIVVDHDIPWLLKFCDYFITLDGGRVANEGTAEALLSGPNLLSELYALAERDNRTPLQEAVTPGSEKMVLGAGQAFARRE
jgi:ABC-type transport system involved in cytochrome bd biosynthesis fused ATPase/permease subunit